MKPGRYELDYQKGNSISLYIHLPGIHLARWPREDPEWSIKWFDGSLCHGTLGKFKFTLLAR
jgi:hypothetical protein